MVNLKNICGENILQQRFFLSSFLNNNKSVLNVVKCLQILKKLELFRFKQTNCSFQLDVCSLARQFSIENLWLNLSTRKLALAPKNKLE